MCERRQVDIAAFWQQQAGFGGGFGGEGVQFSEIRPERLGNGAQAAGALRWGGGAQIHLDEQALGGASDAGSAFDLLQEQILIEVNFWRFKKKIPAVTNALAEEETNIKPEDVLRRMH